MVPILRKWLKLHHANEIQTPSKVPSKVTSNVDVLWLDTHGTLFCYIKSTWDSIMWDCCVQLCATSNHKVSSVTDTTVAQVKFEAAPQVASGCVGNTTDFVI